MGLERTYIYELRPHRDPQRAARGEKEPVLIETTQPRTIEEAVLLHRLQEEEGGSVIYGRDDGDGEDSNYILNDPTVRSRLEAELLADVAAGNFNYDGEDAAESTEEIVFEQSDAEADVDIVVEGSDLNDIFDAMMEQAEEGGDEPAYEQSEEDLGLDTDSCSSWGEENLPEGEVFTVEGGIITFPGQKEIPAGLQGIFTDETAFFRDEQGNIAIRAPDPDAEDMGVDDEDAELMQMLRNPEQGDVEAPEMPADLQQITRSADLSTQQNDRLNRILDAVTPGIDSLAEAAELLDCWVDGNLDDDREVMAKMEAVEEDDRQYRLATAKVNRAVSGFGGPAGVSSLPPGFTASDGRVGRDGAPLVMYSVEAALDDVRRDAIMKASQRFEPIPDTNLQESSSDGAISVSEDSDDANCETAGQGGVSVYRPRQLGTQGQSRAERPSTTNNYEESEDSEGDAPRVNQPVTRPRNETPEERAARKKAIQEEKASRRQTKKAVRTAYRHEQIHSMRSRANNPLGGKKTA